MEISLRVIGKDRHGIDPTAVHTSAVAVVRQLKAGGYDAYVVGGAVRDLMLGGHPKDFDVATNATPEQIRGLFRSARIIGRRFQIVHVRQGREIIEVTTFRGHHQSEGAQPTTSRQSAKGLLLRDNVYGTLDEDAARRDLTVNAMYYDPDAETVLDQMGGVEDIAARLIRVIGDPAARYREDPVRMLRVLRFSAKLQFDIEPDTEYAIEQCASLLGEIPAARLFDEFLKLFMAGYARSTFALMRHHHLFHYLFPETTPRMDSSPIPDKLITLAMASTDKRVQDQRPVTPAFLLAAVLWPVAQYRSQTLCHEGHPPAQSMNSAGQQVAAEACLHIAIPKRFSIPMREIWELQGKLELRKPKRIKELLAHRRFRAAYDLLLLREQAGERLDEAGTFWTEQQTLFPALVGSAPARPEDRPRPRRQRRRRPT